jgi:hypothetical protein
LLTYFSSILPAFSIGSASLPSGACVALPRTTLGAFSASFLNNLTINRTPASLTDPKIVTLLKILDDDLDVSPFGPCPLFLLLDYAFQSSAFKLAHELAHVKYNDHTLKIISTPSLILSLGIWFTLLTFFRVSFAALV